ncbi:MAG: RimK family alpha-L-glutamate ligase [Chloroflexi bacterium]|nr:RimK family alpha-L-glutamate ligase [Chloroflexota bacterium]
MNIVILSRNRNLYSTRRLLEEGRSRDHKVSVIDTLAVAVEISNVNGSGIKVLKPRPRVISAGAWGFSRKAVSELTQIDAVIPRIGTTITEYGLAVVRQFEARGVLTTASSDAIAHSRDKLQSLQIMNQVGIPIPKTAVISKPESLALAIRSVGGTPAIIKLIQGTQGRGVILARNLATAEAVVNKLKEVKRQVLVQEFLAEAEGKDTRVIVVGGKCIAAMERHAPQGDFRSNLHLGGTAVPIQLNPATTQLAIAAAKAHNLAVAGVDIVNSNNGTLVLEVNSSPGLEGIEKVTKINIAAAIFHYLEKKYAQKKSGFGTALI